ncbi:amidohydrolase family protein [Lysobacter sp. 5GHs7-4]|uniref:Xaa-Pro dipeptidase n=1 Tax=Lysobacter sp. 5GHs7-4 TaxID=2904253 RepID=UPI001E651226|nr:amidohydrolase family protein [Lysobacter sp. 5GHs7-4]UHQ23941.1 amidohydrolase family protein [Lysobacter sp. 5GHs7-4]
MRLPVLLALLLLALPGTAARADEGAATPKRIALRAARLVDTAHQRVIERPLVLIEGDKIVGVSAGGEAPAGAQLIDLGTATLLPGFIDLHVHITGDPTSGTGNYFEDILKRSPIDDAVTAHLYAQRTLHAGFTTVRNLGSGEYIDVALARAIEHRKLQGPRILASGLAIGATGGHIDGNTGFSPYLEFHNATGVADGVEAVRAKVRDNVKHGAEVIKFMAGAGVLSAEASVGAPQYTQEEMNAIVDEAHRWGKRVAAHAHGAEAIRMAILAGVDSVEHASFIDDEGLRLAKQKGTWLVMDVYNDDYILAEYSRLGFPQQMIDKEKLVGRTQRESFRRAVRAGVRLGYGTDAGVYPHGDNRKQFPKMVEWGMTPMQALRAATSDAAELLGWSDKVGSVEAGRYADLVAVAGDPLADIHALDAQPVFVMKGGEVVVGQ